MFTLSAHKENPPLRKHKDGNRIRGTTLIYAFLTKCTSPTALFRFTVSHDNGRTRRSLRSPPRCEAPEPCSVSIYSSALSDCRILCKVLHYLLFPSLPLTICADYSTVFSFCQIHLLHTQHAVILLLCRNVFLCFPPK